MIAHITYIVEYATLLEPCCLTLGLGPPHQPFLSYIWVVAKEKG